MITIPTDPSDPSFSYETSPALYLFTSLTAGSSHIITATSRLETILKANRIPFRAIDCATDEKARRIWGRRSRGKKLPGLVREAMVLADLEAVEEWNEFGEIQQNLGAVAAAAAKPAIVAAAKATDKEKEKENTAPTSTSTSTAAQPTATTKQEDDPATPLRDRPAEPTSPCPDTQQPQQSALAAEEAAAAAAALRDKVPGPMPVQIRTSTSPAISTSHDIHASGTAPEAPATSSALPATQTEGVEEKRDGSIEAEDTGTEAKVLEKEEPISRGNRTVLGGEGAGAGAAADGEAAGISVGD